MKTLVALLIVLVQNFTGASGQIRPAESIGIVGDTTDVVVTTEGGFVLAGGSTDVDEAFRWMISRSAGGDFVVIRASGSTGYNDYVYGLGNVNSVETLLIDSREKAMKKDVGERIRAAEALFIAGGDQWRYFDYWTDSEVSEAIRFLIHEKKVPVGGTSAGCAVMSGIVFDARNGTAYSDRALTNPFDSTVSISRSFIEVPFLKNTIADQHYTQRNRLGRHVVFMARMFKDLNVDQARGIGVDEKTAICIDASGEVRVFGQNKVYLLRATRPPTWCEPGKNLAWTHPIEVTVIDAAQNSEPFDIVNGWPVANEQWVVEEGQLIRTPVDR